ncbi:MAG: DUF1819 family protein [Bacteroidales bacterium]|nr:DUF1819 family protein [Bacteroidales bacterium]
MPNQSGKKSPYSASFTARALGYYEMESILPVMLDDSIDDKVRVLSQDSTHLQLATLQSRKRVLAEMLVRFKAVDRSFWDRYVSLGEREKRLALLFVILKSYRLLFELQVNLVIPKYYSPDRVLTKNDVFAAISEVACRDEFVDSWSEDTRNRAASQYVTILRQAGLIDEASGELREPNVADDELAYYVRIGEIWFLQACLLPGYRVEQIKQIAL